MRKSIRKLDLAAYILEYRGISNPLAFQVQLPLGVPLMMAVRKLEMDMHARWLIDVAALLTYHADAIVQRGIALPIEVMNRYWLASRQRFDAWNRALRELSQQLEGSNASQRVMVWKQLQPIIEEVFLSDVSVRCMVALTHRLEVANVDRDSLAIADSIFGGQEDLRNRCLHLISGGIGLSTDTSFQLNRVRQSMEIWSDTLVGMIDDGVKLDKYVFNKTSVLDSAYLDRQQSSSRQHLRWHFMIAGCQQWISQHCNGVSINTKLNRDIYRSMLNLMEPQWIEAMCYDSSEITGSENLIAKIQGMVDELVISNPVD